MEYLEMLLQYEDTGLFILRIGVGLVFLYHGAPKLKNATRSAKGLGMPPAATFLIGAVELVSGAALILGVLTQLAALALTIVMIGAIPMKIGKWKIPYSAQDKTGWEFDLVLLSAALCLLLTGGGSIGLL